MSRYCGVCGASLGLTSLTTGRCEQCNARVENYDPSIDERNIVSGEAPTLAGRENFPADPAHTQSSSLALPRPRGMLPSGGAATRAGVFERPF